MYKKLQQIKGPLLFIKNKHKVKYGEFVDIHTNDGNIRTGQVIKINEELILVEVFQNTKGISSENAKIIFSKDAFKVKISNDMFGRTFNSFGKPFDINTNEILETEMLTKEKRYIEGEPINPFARKYPKNIIQTGISAIDCLFSIVRGQKLPIFSGQGLPHNKLAAQIAIQAKILTDEPFLIIFCGIGIIQDDAIYFLNKFQESGKLRNIISFINFVDDPIMERLIIIRVALTTAEYFAFEQNMHVLIILINMTNYAEALRELSSAREEIPGRKGYPGYIYSDFASIYERSGMIKGKKGSITQIPILTMPNDDITHPIPDTSGYITEGQIILDRNLHKKNIYPPLDISGSISRLMKDAIGDKNTREDHADLCSQLVTSYISSLDVRELVSIVGEEGLNSIQRPLLKFADDFEQKFLNQDFNESREITTSFKKGWEVLSNLPKNNLFRINKKFIEKYYL